MTEDPGREVRIERTFDAPAEDVFDAWTSEEVIRRRIEGPLDPHLPSRVLGHPRSFRSSR